MEVCIDAENVHVTLGTYQERLMYLRKLQHSNEENTFTFSSTTALRFLIGNLFINFSVIWEPVIEIISSYVTDETQDEFWIIWRDTIHMVSSECGKTFFLAGSIFFVSPFHVLLLCDKR